jgi:two-component system NtrC family sensor kinase
MAKAERKKVLIVEDEPDLAAVFVNLLDIFDLDCRTAESAQSAQAIVSKEKFDFLIIDLTLPDLSGIDLYQDIVLKSPEYKGQVIFTSGMNISDELNQIMAKDNTSFLAKPFSLDKLKQVLQKWI